METEDIIWIIVGVLVLLALVALAMWLLRRRAAKQREERMRHADHLRTEAAGRTTEVESAAARAQQAEIEAERARARAEHAEHEAAAAHQGFDHERAAQEDVVRRADETDPRVDTTAEDYRPITGPDLKGGGTTT